MLKGFVCGVVRVVLANIS